MNGVAAESLLQMPKVPCKNKVIAPNGPEVVWEIITALQLGLWKITI